MPIQFPDFGRISFDEANPLLVGMERGQKFGQSMMQFPQDLRAKILANQIAQAQAKYAEPMAKEGLTKAQQENLFNPRIWESEIGLRGSTSGLNKAQTKKINYQLEHPGFMGDDTTKAMAALQQMGLVDENFRPVNRGQVQGQPQPSQMQQQGQQQPGMPMQPNMQMQQQPLGNQMGGGFSPIPGNMQAQQIAQALQAHQQQQQQRQQMQPGQPGLPGQPQNQGFDVQSLVQALIQKPMTDLNYKRTLTAVMNQNLQAKPFMAMPAVEKEYALSQARAFGYTGEESSRLLQSQNPTTGQPYTLKDLAALKGIDPMDTSSWPIARGAPTTAIQTRIQRANSTLAGLDAVEPYLIKAASNYLPRFNNVSPSLIKDMLTGQNINDQIQALTAYALYPEMQALRINAQGGNVGEGAIQHMADASYARLNTLKLSPGSKVQQGVIKELGKLIRKMNKAENSEIYGQRNRSFEEDDRNSSASSNSDLASMSTEELKKIAGE